MNYKWVTVCPDWVIFKKFLVTNFLAKEAQISNDFLVLGSYNHGPPYLLIFINKFVSIAFFNAEKNKNILYAKTR